jgi:CheY-like chemotaxis protein
MVLVVEDGEPLRKLIASMLRAGGYQVLEAADGAEALAVFAQESDSIDLILTDVVMPRMNGTELADRLSLLRHECPVVFMSGYVDNSVVQSVMSGNGSFLRKPFTAQTLVAFIRRCLQQAGDRAGATGSPLGKPI